MSTDPDDTAATSTALVRALDPETRERLAAALKLLHDRLGSAHSRRAYRTDWLAWLSWLAARGTSPLAVQPWDVQTYVAELVERGKASKTRQRALHVLRATYGVIVQAGLVAVNPARETKNPKHGRSRKTPWLEPDELVRLVAATDGDSWIARRDRAVVAVMAGLALRRAEVARMRWADFREHEGRPVLDAIVKGNQERVFAVPTWLFEELRAWLLAGEFPTGYRGVVFPPRPGADQPMTPQAIRTIVARAAVRAGLDDAKVTPHALRRSAATHALRSGADIRDIQLMLGHASVTTTEKYIMGLRLPDVAPGEHMGSLFKPKGK